MKKKKVAKPGRRRSFKMWLKKKLDTAQANVRKHKYRSKAGEPESQEEGKLRTEQHNIAQAVFDAIREIHEEL